MPGSDELLVARSRLCTCLVGPVYWYCGVVTVVCWRLPGFEGMFIESVFYDSVTIDIKQLVCQKVILIKP